MDGRRADGRLSGRTKRKTERKDGGARARILAQTDERKNICTAEQNVEMYEQREGRTDGWTDG